MCPVALVCVKTGVRSPDFGWLLSVSMAIKQDVVSGQRQGKQGVELTYLPENHWPLSLSLSLSFPGCSRKWEERQQLIHCEQIIIVDLGAVTTICLRSKGDLLQDC